MARFFCSEVLLLEVHLAPLLEKDFCRAERGDSTGPVSPGFSVTPSWSCSHKPDACLARLAISHCDARLERTQNPGQAGTSHRVMAAVFDGDPQPLYEIILDAAVKGSSFNIDTKANEALMGAL